MNANFEVLKEGDPKAKVISWYIGSIDTSYDKIVEKLGAPTSEGGAYKIDAEWIVYFPDIDTIAVIYNYKNGINYLGENITDWDIGGSSERLKNIVVKKVYDILGY
jgi:hypothetical protein